MKQSGLYKSILTGLFLTAAIGYSQTVDSVPKSDSLAPASVTPPSAPLPAPPVSKSESQSVIRMEFLKEKTIHSPDSTFFNILKITNTNAKTVKGVVRISVPIGWKVISAPETAVSIEPGETFVVPVRVSLARTVTGGVSYVVNATLSSDRALVHDKNQTSASKAFYITIPRKTKWEVYPLARTIYFDKYSEYAQMKLRVINQGNGYQLVKFEFDIGSSLELYGSMGGKYFGSVELKPHRDTVLTYHVKYKNPMEPTSWNRDFRKLSIKIAAKSDTLVKHSTVTFKFLESSYCNPMADRTSPLTIDVQMQNLLSEFDPRLMFSAYGDLYFKNEHALDYFLRFPNIALYGYASAQDFGENLWYRSRMRARYMTDKWQIMAGDIGSSGISLLPIGGRGLGGDYRINANHKVGGLFTAGISYPVYSGHLYHETTLPKNIGLTSSLSAIIDNYNNMQNLGASVSASYPINKDHLIRLTLSGSQLRHLYDNQTFTDPNGNFISTVDPGASFIGYGGILQYQARMRKMKASLNAQYTSAHFSQYNNGRLNLNTTAQYYINSKYFIVANAAYHIHEPNLYNRGLLFPKKYFSSGRYRTELGIRMSNRLVLYGGPMLDHIYQRHYKVRFLQQDTVLTRFSSLSPKLSLRLNYRNSASGSVNPYLMMGYTMISQAEDSTLGIQSAFSQDVYFNAHAGVSVVQQNWGVNVFYYYGPHDLIGQSDYFYFNKFSKSIRVMPYFEKYYFNKTLLLNSYSSYYYEASNNSERINLNARLTFFINRSWNLYVDNNLYMFSRVTQEGTKTYARSYYLNLGFKKSFDIPQPGIKFHDVKVVCFKDMNGNKIMDSDEYGIPDVVIVIDRDVKADSSASKSNRRRSQFTPGELVTDNFGMVSYCRVPHGDYTIGVNPLLNLADLYNINGSNQPVSIFRDTTIYIPFVQSYRVRGKIVLNRDEYSSAGAISPANVRIVATDSSGNSFPALSGFDGSYTLYVPQAGEYKLTINHVFGDRFTLQESEYTVSFDGAKEFQVDFIFNEAKRKMNINNGSSGAPSPVSGSTNPPPPAGTGSVVPTNSVSPTPADTSSGRNLAPASGGSAGELTYRVQLASSANRIPASQYTTRFKGVANIQEYFQDGTYRYTTGDYKTWEFEKATEYKDQLIQKGFKDAFVIFFKDGKRIK